MAAYISGIIKLNSQFFIEYPRPDVAPIISAATSTSMACVAPRRSPTMMEGRPRHALRDRRRHVPEPAPDPRARPRGGRLADRRPPEHARPPASVGAHAPLTPDREAAALPLHRDHAQDRREARPGRRRCHIRHRRPRHPNAAPHPRLPSRGRRGPGEPPLP